MLGLHRRMGPSVTGPPLFVAALCAPLIATHPNNPTVLHAATMDAVIEGWDKGTVTSACGQTGLKLPTYTADNLVIPWPPRIRSLPEGTTRCRQCQQATGSGRPRSSWKAGTA
jgi:hypothetical protein